MISETHFASAYTAFWDQLLPMGGGLVRAINMASERWCPPLESVGVEADRRALVNEIGFRVFRAKAPRIANGRPYTLRTEQIASIEEESRQYVEKLRRASHEPVSPPSKEEMDEAIRIADRIMTYLETHEAGQAIVVSPSFLGCGRLQACSGDLLAGQTLYEIKSGDRHFRLVDVRQLLTYCALNHRSKVHPVEKLGLLNPRVGVFNVLQAETFVRQASGRSLVEISNEIVDFLSRDMVSR